MSKIMNLLPYGDKPISFEGIPVKIQLISNAAGFGVFPAPDRELEQRIIIHRDGRVWFSGYAYENYFEKKKKIRSKQFKVNPAGANLILARIAYYYSERFDIHMVTDIGTFDIKITTEDGAIYKADGSLFSDDGELDSISALIRKILGMDDLFLFDGDARFPVTVADGQYIVATVCFDDDNVPYDKKRRYNYLCDDPLIQEYDQYYVETVNGKKIVEIMEVDIMTKEEMPFPFEKMKYLGERL